MMKAFRTAGFGNYLPIVWLFVIIGLGNSIAYAATCASPNLAPLSA